MKIFRVFFFQTKTPQKSNKKKNKNSSDDFSFEFTKNSKIKAIVARKRTNVPKATIPVDKKKVIEAAKGPTVTLLNNSKIQPKIKAKEQLPIPKKPVESELTLNVSTTPIEAPVSAPSSQIVKNIFDPERQKRFNALKEKISVAPTKSGPTTTNTNQKPKPPRRGEAKNSLFNKNPEIPVMGQRLVKPIFEKVFTGVSMGDIGLHPHSVKNIKDLLNITELTTVQQRTIPVILKNRDVLVRSQTGSGKTLAYALPIVEKLQEIRPKLTRDCGVQALIVVPTRELAMQSYELLLKLLKPFTWIVTGYLSGGEKRKAEKARLRKGINILVGTPGRLVDHLMHTESFKLDQVKWLVLDEADRLFELGYEKDVSKIVDALNGKSLAPPPNPNQQRSNFAPARGNNRHKKFDDDDDEYNEEEEKKEETPVVEIKPKEPTPNKALQSILLSATLTSAVEQLAGLTLKNPMFIDTADVSKEALPGGAESQKETSLADVFKDAATNEQLTIPSTVALSYMIVPPKQRLVALSGMIALESSKKIRKILVFVATQDLVDFHHDIMVEILTRRVLDEDDEDADEDDTIEEDGLLVGVRFFK